jgi:pimeloyl-ACP methyl ester carboxylesterase
VDDQAGIVAAQDLEVAVGGHTHLEGGLLAGEAVALETGSFSFADIEDRDRSAQDSFSLSVSLGTDADGGVGAGGAVPGIVYGGTISKITPEEVAAYNAPFPDARFQAGAREFPMLVPDTPNNPASAANRAAWEVLGNLETPFLTVFGADDKIMAGVDRVFQRLIPGAAGQKHAILPNAGHFLQEDVGAELAQATLEFIARN